MLTEHLKSIIRDGKVKQGCHLVVANIFLKMRMELHSQLCCLQHNLTKVPVYRTSCFMNVCGAEKLPCRPHDSCTTLVYIFIRCIQILCIMILN